MDEFAGRADRLASPVRLVELGAKRKPKLRSTALLFADVLLRVKLKAELFN